MLCFFGLILIIVSCLGFSYLRKTDKPLEYAHCLITTLLTFIYFSFELWVEINTTNIQLLEIIPLYLFSVILLCNECRNEFKEYCQTRSRFSSIACTNIILQVTLYFALIYMMLEVAVPGSFLNEKIDDYFAVAVEFLYFSLMIFSTVGFGDITPNNTWAKTFVIIEIMMSFYLIVIIVNFFSGNGSGDTENKINCKKNQTQASKKTVKRRKK